MTDYCNLSFTPAAGADPAGHPHDAEPVAVVDSVSPSLPSEVPTTGEPMASTWLSRVSSEYRAGMGVAYSAALLDLKHALDAHPIGTLTHGKVLAEFIRLLAALPERCDQIAEAQP